MLELLTDPNAWIACCHAHCAGTGAGHRQHHFHFHLVDTLPEKQRELARRLETGMAMFMRIGLLLVLAWIIGLTAQLFTVLDQRSRTRPDPDRRRTVPAVEKHQRIHQSLEGEEGPLLHVVKATFTAVIQQIMVVDLVFPLDSISPPSAWWRASQ